METIKEVLIRRDGISADEADELIAEARAQMELYIAENDYFAAEDICNEFFGLEPDYLMELMPA